MDGGQIVVELPINSSRVVKAEAIVPATPRPGSPR